MITDCPVWPCFTVWWSAVWTVLVLTEEEEEEALFSESLHQPLYVGQIEPKQALYNGVIIFTNCSFCF